MFSISTSVGQLEPNKWHVNGPRISCIRIIGWISLLYLIWYCWKIWSSIRSMVSHWTNASYLWELTSCWSQGNNRIYILCIFQHVIREFCMLLAHLKLKMDPEILLYLNSTRQQVAGHITKLIHLRFGQFALWWPLWMEFYTFSVTILVIYKASIQLKRLGHYFHNQKKFIWEVLLLFSMVRKVGCLLNSI